LTDNHEEFPKRQAHLIKSILKKRYYRDDRPLDEDQGSPPEGVVEYIKPQQLLAIYDLIHEEVEFKYHGRFVFPPTDAEVEQKIQAKQTMFGTMLDNAIKEMWDIEDEDDPNERYQELYDMREGWNAGEFRSYHTVRLCQ
jgi:hypothetical protein